MKFEDFKRELKLKIKLLKRATGLFLILLLAIIYFDDRLISSELTSFSSGPLTAWVLLGALLIAKFSKNYKNEDKVRKFF